MLSRALALVLVFLCCRPVAFAQSREFEQLKLADGSVLRYALVLPDSFDASTEYPTLLALPPGDQGERMVEEGLKRYWEQAARKRGWVVVSPVAVTPGGFVAMDPAAFELLMRTVNQRVKSRGLWHLAGASNGGKAAFHLAIQRPQWFQSLLVLPGFPPTDDDSRSLSDLKGLRVTLLVGGLDTSWLEQTRTVTTALQKAGVNAAMTVYDNQPHVLTVSGEELFTMLDAGSSAGPQADVSAALDDFHDAAARADEPRYFGHFAKDGVFIGTDATERWTRDEFREWAKPYFSKGKAWTYTPRDRHVFISADGQTAWFDEFLDNLRLGECRGTGVLIREGGAWKIAQYHLVLPVPNEMANQVADKAKELKKQQ